MKNYKAIEVIEKYLAGALDTKEQQAFEEALKEDVSLKQEVFLHQDLVKGIGAFRDNKLESNINLIKDNLETQGFFDKYKSDAKQAQTAELDEVALQNKVKGIQENLDKEGFFESYKAKETAIIKPMFSRRIMAMAASFLVLISAGVFIFQNNLSSTTKYSSLYANNFEVDEVQLNDKMADLNILGIADKNKKQKRGLRDALKNYKTCIGATCKIKSLANHLKVFPEDETALFYTALANMEAANHDNATYILKQLYEKSDSPLTKQVQWYLGLAYLQTPNKVKDGMVIFQAISEDSQSNYQEKAQILLKKLNE